METKTIWFEKGERYADTEIWNYLNNIPYSHFERQTYSNVLICLKSFTVQINIIEDGE